MRSWIGASAGDVLIRLVAQLLSTVVIVRILTAEDFGLASMILSSVAIVGALVSLPFEEALTQRSRLNTKHLQAALFVSLALTLIALLVVIGFAPALSRLSGAPDLALWLPIATLFLFGQGPGSIARAVARRRRRFVDLAVGQSASVIIASVVAIIAAIIGWGVFALVLQRMLPVVLYPVIVSIFAWSRVGSPLISPKWDAASFGDIVRFSWFHLARVGVDYTTPAILSFMVNAFFGTAVLGQLNVAMRVTEPLRAGIASVGHNLALSFLVRFRNDTKQLVGNTLDTVANVAALAVPAFLGLGVCSPLLIPLLFGAGWEEAIPLSRSICIAAAISVPFRYLYSGYSALGRPEYSLICASVGLLTLFFGLTLVGHGGHTDLLGVPIVVMDGAIALLGILIYTTISRQVILKSLLTLLRVWIAAGVMALFVDLIFLRTGFIDPSLLKLVTMAATGGLAYSLALYAVCRPCYNMIYGLLFKK